MIRRSFPRMATAKPVTHYGSVQVPAHFRTDHPFKYPIDNSVEFERWYLQSFKQSDSRERLYLPIFWTSYFCSHKFGKDPRAMNNLQQFINSLDRSNKYYTLCQYDDGPMVDFKDLDIIVFGMAGGRNDFPIPLLCQPHAYSNPHEKDILCSFVGRITHPFRSQMAKQVQGKPGFYISTKDHKMDQYCSIMARSKYALCPRGYSATSFRISEAIQYGAIPIYLSDHHILPYNLPFDYGILAKPGDNIAGLIQHKKVIEPDKNLFTYQGCKDMILQKLAD